MEVVRKVSWEKINEFMFHFDLSFVKYISRIVFEMCLVENTAEKLYFKELWGYIF